MKRLTKAALLIAILPLLSLRAGSQVAVQQLDAMLTAARSAGSPDERTADKIAHLDLKERLTRATLARLASGVGERTAAALELLADRSAYLDPPAAEIAPGEPPSPVEQRAIVETAAAYALAYTRELPNIVCSRIVSRFDDLGVHSYGQLSLHDTLAGEWTVRGGAESFQTQHAGLVTERANAAAETGRGFQGLTTSGEFGSVLAEPFAGHTSFTWRRWETLDGKRVAVVGYSLPQQGSRFSVSWCCLDGDPASKRLSQQAAYQGEMSIDPDSGAILRVTQQAVHLPKEFPIKQAWTIVEYQPVTLAGRSFLLPARSLSFTDALPPASEISAPHYAGQRSLTTYDHEHYLNRLEFRNYRKFAAESSLVFGTESE
jgi:hypothetical protein